MSDDVNCKSALFQMRDLLKDIDQKLSHLIEQNRMERHLFFKDFEERENESE